MSRSVLSHSAISDAPPRRLIHQVNTVLTELERHEGLCILATNRPMDLDEAMHRRITVAVEFTKPDLLLRERIWREMAPPKLPLAEGIDFMALARKYGLPSN